MKKVSKYLFIFTPNSLNWCQTRCCSVRWIQLSARNHLWCCMWTMFANISLCLPLILSNGVTRHVVEYDDLRSQPEILCNSVWSKLANIYLFVPLTLSNGVKRDVVEYDEFRFQVEIICNAVRRMFANIYLYLPLILSNGVTRHVVECDKLRIQPVIICNAVCEQSLQISIYISHLFSEMVSHDMLLSMINYYFSQKSFVMLYANNLCKYLFMFPPYFLKFYYTTCCWVRWTQISARIDW